MVSEKLGAAFIEIGVDTGGLTTGLAGAKAQVTGFGASASSAFAGLASSINPVTIAIAGATAAVAALGAGIASSVSAAANFQQSMANVASVTGGGAEALEALSNAAREAGSSTVFSAMEAADAQYYLASAGMNTEDIISSLNDTLLLAGAGNLDMGRAAEIVTNSLSQFNMEASESGRIANVLAAAAAGSNTTVSQMGIGMAKVGPIANALGMSFEQTSASLMVLANAGIKGEEGGTMLRGVLSSLMDISPKAAETLAEMGLSAEDIDPALNSIDEIMVKLNESGMTASQAVKIFGREASSAAINLAAGADNIKSYEEAITGTSKAQEMYNTQTDTFQGSMKMLSSAISEAKIALGTVFLPVLSDAVDWLAKGVVAATDFGKSIYGVGQRINEILSPLGGFAGIAKEFAQNQLGGGLVGAGKDLYARGKDWFGFGEETGEEIGKNVGIGVGKGIFGTGTAITKELESADGEGAGEKVGGNFGEAFGNAWSKEWEAAFLEGTATMGGFSKESLDSMHKAGMRAIYADGAIVGYESRDKDKNYRYGETFEAGGSTVGLRYEKGGQTPWLLTIGDWFRAFDTQEQARAYISEHFLTLDDLISPEQWEIAYKTARGSTVGKYDDPGDVVKLKAKLSIEPDMEAANQDLVDQLAREWEETQKILDEQAAQHAAAIAESFEQGAFVGDMKTAMEDLGETGAKAFSDGWISGTEAQDMVNQLIQLQFSDPEAFAAAGGEEALNFWRGMQEKLTDLSVAIATGADPDSIREMIADIKSDLDSSEFKIDITAEISKTLFGREISEKDIPALADLIADPEALKKTVQNWEQWSANTYQPALQHHIDEAEAKWASGYYSQSELNKDYFRDLMTNALQYSDWYEGWQLGLLGAYARGDIGLQQFFDMWETGGKAIEGASKAIAEERQNLASLTAEAALCGETMSDFGLAQEKMSDRLFNQTRIMNTGDYIEDVAAAIARGDWVHPATEAFARQQASDRGIDFEARVSANTEQATKDMEEFAKFVEESDSKAPISASLQPAYDAVDSFLGWVNNISASVYVDAYGPGTEYTGGGGYLESLSPGITSSPGWGTPSWLPVLDSGGIVTGPIIASLAQDNRPEAIIPLDQITKIIGGGGGNTYNISVNGGGNAEEIARAIRGAIEDYDREKNRSGAYA